MKLKNIYTKNKYLLFSGVLALAITCGITIQEDDGSIKVSDSIFLMNVDDDTINETAEFDSVQTEKQGLVIEEKVAIDPIYIFSSVNELKYNTQTISVKIEPKDDCNDYGTIEKGSEISVLGYNDFGYVKILFDNQELYIKDQFLTDNKDEIFFECDYTRYTSDEIELCDGSNSVLMTIDQYAEVEVIGENDNYSMVIYDNTWGYVSNEDLIEYLPVEVYAERTSNVDYYVDNMVEGVYAVVPEEEQTEENLVYLAKLIHCEAGGQTEEGKLAVATVVVNRLYDQRLGKTVSEVIERPGQFQPVSSGKIAKTGYTDDDYAAAKKVLIDGYRSFPAYVLYFQSIREGYFAGQRTYCICYNANGTSPQYYSYKLADLQKYEKQD